MTNVLMEVPSQKSAVKSIRMEAKLRNSLILTMMEERGIKSLSELARSSGCNYSKLCHLVAMKLPALNKDGSWQKDALRLSDFFCCIPEDLFSSEQQLAALETNRTQVEMDYTELQLLSTVQSSPDKIAQARELKRIIAQQLLTLTPRENRVLALRFGLNGVSDHTLEEIAEMFSVIPERIRQIEAKALRKLRSNARGDTILTHVSSENKLTRLDDGVLEALGQI